MDSLGNGRIMASLAMMVKRGRREIERKNEEFCFYCVEF